MTEHKGFTVSCSRYAKVTGRIENRANVPLRATITVGFDGTGRTYSAFYDGAIDIDFKGSATVTVDVPARSKQNYTATLDSYVHRGALEAGNSFNGAIDDVWVSEYTVSPL